MTDGLPALEIAHEGRGATKVYQDIPVSTIPSHFSGDFRFHLVDTWGHSSFLAFIELAFCDKDGNVLGKHVWYYGALRENWGIQTTESSTSSKTDLRGSQGAFSELESSWINCQLDVTKALRETLTGIDQSKLKTMRITMDGRSDSKKGFMKMWARNIEVNFGNSVFQHCTNFPPVIQSNQPAPTPGLATEHRRIPFRRANDGTFVRSATPVSGTPLGETTGKWTGTWQIQNSTFSVAEGTNWVERKPNGEQAFTFTLVRRTNRLTELYDKSRNFTLLIYLNGESEWTAGNGWNLWYKGKWIE